MALVQRSNGIRSRGAILDRGARLAQRGGLHTATIGALAEGLGMSKSGVFAHFGSKEALDVALVDAAAERFARAVLGPAGAAPAGIARVAALAEGFLTFVTQPPDDAAPRLTPEHPAFALTAGAATARLETWRNTWHGALTAAVTDSIAQGELAPAHDPAQVVFELDALLDAAGRAWRRQPSVDVASRTRRAIDRLLLA